MKLFIIIVRETFEVVRDKAYVNLRDAKLALRYHFGKETKKYGIGVVERTTKLAWYIDDNDEWEEVSE